MSNQMATGQPPRGGLASLRSVHVAPPSSDLSSRVGMSRNEYSELDVRTKTVEGEAGSNADQDHATRKR